MVEEKDDEMTKRTPTSGAEEDFLWRPHLHRWPTVRVQREPGAIDEDRGNGTRHAQLVGEQRHDATSWKRRGEDEKTNL